MGFRLFSPVWVVISFALLLGLVLYSRTLALENKVPLVQPFSKFPTELGDFKLLQEVSLDEATMEALKPTDAMMRYYQRTPTEPPVSLWIPYFAEQEEESRIHNPSACLPGAGWRYVRRTAEPLPWRGGTSDANLVLLQKGLDRQMALYWIHSNGRIIADEYKAKLYLLQSVFTRRRSDGALVRFMTVLMRDESPEQGRQRLLAAAEETLPVLPEFLPD